MEKMTKKDCFATIMAEMADNAEIVAFCENEIALLEKKAAKAKENAAKRKAEGDALTDAVLAALTDEFAPIADITAQIEGEDVTPAKVTYRLTQLVKAGKAQKADLVIEGTDGAKSRKIAGYAIA